MTEMLVNSVAVESWAVEQTAAGAVQRDEYHGTTAKAENWRFAAEQPAGRFAAVVFVAPETGNSVPVELM